MNVTTMQNELRHRAHVSRAIGAGFVATVLMTILMYGGPSVGLPRLDIAAMIGSFLTGGLPVIKGGGVWWTGMIVHFFDLTILFPVIYAAWAYSWFGGPPLVRGISYGIALWLLSEIIVMPIVGAGFFNDQAAAQGAVVAGLFFAHLLYGFVLGGMGGHQTEYRRVQPPQESHTHA